MPGQVFRRFLGHSRTVSQFGVKNWLAIVASRGRGPIQLTSRHAQYPLLARPGTSDLAAFRQVFVQREYICLDDVRDPGLIMDCGANVGYASAYFLSRFPRAEVIAVEPDPENFDVLRVNLAPYGGRARPIRGAVWSHSTRLAMASTGYRDAEEWARQVRECEPGDPEGFQAFGIGDLLRESGRERIDIMKVDIEGSEAVVFANGYQSWIDRVDVLAVELHDDTVFGPATDIVLWATRGFDMARSGELSVFRRQLR